MRILDKNNMEITSPDLELGYLVDETIFVEHHDAIAAVPAVTHEEIIKEYPNGGKDARIVVDVPAVEGKDAWDEYENIQRYVLYTEAELTAMEIEKNRPTVAERLEAIEFALMELMGVSAE